MRSPRSPFGWLLAKEWRELWSARAWWLLLVIAGPLAGMSFINAVQIYAELSGYNGTTQGVGEAFSPLVGVWTPTFSAYEIIAAFLFPFVVIRLVAGDRHSGALKLELQQRMSPWARMSAKALVLSAGWLIAMTPAAIAAALWMSYGGHVYPAEVLTVLAGHLLNAGLTIAIGTAAASATEHPATAAIIALAVTVGTWIISFFAAIRGGWWERVAAFTPPAMVAEFQRGLIRVDIVVSVVALTLLGVLIGGVWMQLGEPVGRRAWKTLALAAGAGAVIVLGTYARPSWDASENRQNSFPETDEAALSRIREPLRIEAHLAPDDGRRAELEQGALSKLRRVMPHLTVAYVSRTSVGLFEQNTEHYGEIIYTMDGRQEVSRVVTPEGVLENVYRVAGMTPPAENDADVFRGFPLATPPRHAAAVFYGVWPVLIAGAWFRHWRTT